MIIFCYRDIIEFNYDVLPQTTWGLEVIHDMSTILLGPAMTGVARRQTSKGVVPGSCPCKVKRLAGRLAGSEKQRLPKKKTTPQVGLQEGQECIIVQF